MPFIRLSAHADDFDIFYRSNLPPSANPNFSNNRPTILLLPPAFLSIDYLNEQFDDPVLSATYNLVAFDPPGYGLSRCSMFEQREQANRIDDWVMAALVGDFCLALGIPEVHIFAPMAWAAYVGPRVSLLFPGLCRSITMCGISYGAKWSPEYREGMLQIGDGWIHAGSREDLETCLQNFHFIFFGETRIDPDLSKRVHATWRKSWWGPNMVNFMVFGPFSLMRVELTAEQVAQVTTPIFIIHGDTMQFTPPQMAYDMGASFTSITPLPLGVPLSPTSPTSPSAPFCSTRSSPSAPFPSQLPDTLASNHDVISFSDETFGVPIVGAGVEIIPKAPYGLSILPTFAPRVNRILAAHVDAAELADLRTKLAGTPPSASSVNSPSLWATGEAQQLTPAQRRKQGMESAFERLTALAGPDLVAELELAGKDPMSALSFSLRPKSVEQEGYEKYFLPCLDASKSAKGVQA